MNDGMRPRADAGGFDAMDPRLTVFALANGMDLTKGEDYRRLEWFTDGLERGILIELQPGGTFRVGVRAWPFGSNDMVGQSTIAEAVESVGVVGLLEPAIAEANGL